MQMKEVIGESSETPHISKVFGWYSRNPIAVDSSIKTTSGHGQYQFMQSTVFLVCWNSGLMATGKLTPKDKMGLWDQMAIV